MNELGNLLKSLNGKKIAYDVVYTKITGRLTAGVMLSQLMYWYSVMGGREFYKSNEELCEETGLSIDELKSAKKLLENKGFIKVELKSLPRKTYYTINEEVLINALTSGWKSHQPVGGNSTDCMVEIPPTTSESTTENKTDIYIEKKSKKQKQDILESTEHIEILNYYNMLFSSNRPSKDKSWVDNADYWLQTYTLDEIKLAIKNWHTYPHWSKKDGKVNGLTFLFRRFNTAREKVNYIDEMLKLDMKPTVEDKLTKKQLIDSKWEEMYRNAY